MRVIITYLFCLISCTQLSAQLSLKGKVITADGGKPVALANVFLANTSIGTVSNEKGEFVIEQFPAGRYDLVVSFIGYESYVISLQSNRLPVDLEIKLKIKVNELKEVVLEPYEKDGWTKWGLFFMENFIGTSAFAEDCKLMNKDVIKFRFNRKKNILQAFADDRLVIENKALGYLLKYDLISFDFDFNTKRFFYQGYPLFEEMKAKREGIQKKWISNRQDAYYGSMMHFMRSLFRNKLIEQQFEVRKIIKLSSEEQVRVKAAYLKARIPVAMNGHQVIVNDSKSDIHPDTLAYYRKVIQTPEDFNVLINQVLPGDSIAYAVDSISVGLDFSDYLQIVYPPKKAPIEYGKSIQKILRDVPITSEIFRLSSTPIIVLSNGTYFEGTNLISTQYWAWSEKIASLLPVDYWPPPKKMR
ncbi:MAG: carboxypeptidase-like regulatory domain-containing protein [Bacteroidota bacterium]